MARALSKFGVSSRTEAVRLIEAGRVRVDGRIATDPARWIDPRAARVEADGVRVGDDVSRVVIALHKPVGYVTTRTDPGGRATVYDLLADVDRWVFPVGRLDRDTSGLLILTNDHRLGHALADPAHQVIKTYHARVAGLPDAEALRAMREGLLLDDGDPRPTRPAAVRVLGGVRGGESWLGIRIGEGRNRQVRRMCAAVGHEVRELVRIAIGGLALGDLGSGEWRVLDPGEVARLSGRRHPPRAREA